MILTGWIWAVWDIDRAEVVELDLNKVLMRGKEEMSQEYSEGDGIRGARVVA